LLEDIDPEVLFEQFESIVRITEDEDLED
jgi:hypothetical protein